MKRLLAAILLIIGLAVTQPASAAGLSRVNGAHALAYTTSWAKVIIRDPKTHKVIYRHRYGSWSEGKTLSLPACNCNGTGSDRLDDPLKVIIGMQGHSTLGETIWKFDIWTKWYWDLVGLDHYVHLDSSGHDITASRFWSWDGVIESSHHYFTWCCSVADSGYHHMQKGSFDGPSIGGLNSHEYPKIILDSHSNGSWYWSTHCCG